MTPPYVSEDLMIEILSRLPVKTLMRFMCLSKSLKSLISNSFFVKLHLKRSHKNINLLYNYSYLFKTFTTENNSLSTIVKDFDFDPRLKPHKVVGSCNGLVCLLKPCSGRKYVICLWNPATKSKSYTTPLVAKFKTQTYSFPNPMYGFGYDSLLDTYKVVIVNFNNIDYYGHESIESEVHIYTERNNSWRCIESFPGFSSSSQFNGKHLNGTIYWLAISNHDTNSYRYLHNHWYYNPYIVSLDLGKETYTQLSLPSCFVQSRCVNGGRAKESLGILKDRLCFSHDDLKRTHFVLWQMNEYGVENSWTQLLKVNYYAIQHTQEYCILPPMGTLKGEYLILFESIDGTLRATTLFEGKNRANIPKDMVWLCTKDYVGTLVSPRPNY